MTCARGVRTLAAAALAAVLAATFAPTDIPPAGAQAVSTRSLRLAAQTSWVPAGGSFDLHLDLRGGAPTPDLDLVVSVHAPVRNRSVFAQTIEGRAGRVRKTVTLGVDDAPVDGSGALVVSLPLPRADRPVQPTTLPALTEGIYPVTVSLRDDDNRTLDRFVTHLVRLPDDPALKPLSVAWVQSLGVEPLLRADGTRDLRRTERVALETGLAAVADNPDVPLTLAVTPETVAALPAAEVAPLRRAVEAGDQLLATPYVDVDPSALEAANLGRDLALQRQVGEDALAEAIGSRGDPRTWSADQPLTAAAARRLRTLGITRLVLPENALVPLDPSTTDGRTLTRPFALDVGAEETVQAAAVDTTLTSYFAADDPVLAAHHLLADLAVLFRDLPGTARGVVIRPRADWTPNAAFLGVVLPALEVPILRPVTLEQLFDQVTPLRTGDRGVVRSLAEPVPGDVLPAARLQEAHTALDELMALVGPSSPRVPPARARLLVAESRRLSARSRGDLLDDVLARRDDVEAGIRVPQRRVRLTARDGTIPVTVVNDTGVPVRVQLVLSSDKLEFTDVEGGDRSRQVLPLVLEHRTQTLTIHVRARVSATFSLQARVLSPGGAEILRSRFTIVSLAFSGVGIFLSIGAGLFLLLWWGRHWRTVRRDRRLVEVPN